MKRQITFDGPSRQALKSRWYIYTKNFPSSKTECNDENVDVYFTYGHRERAIPETADNLIHSWGPENRRLETGEKVRIDKHRFGAFHERLDAIQCQVKRDRGLR